MALVLSLPPSGLRDALTVCALLVYVSHNEAIPVLVTQSVPVGLSGRSWTSVPRLSNTQISISVWCFLKPLAWGLGREYSIPSSLPHRLVGRVMGKH